MILLEWISWKDFIDKETGIEKLEMTNKVRNWQEATL